MKEKEIRVLMVEPHEHPKEVILENSYRAIEEAVGGTIDIIGYDRDVCMLIHDEGKLIGLEGNRHIGSDIIAGTFYVCGCNNDGDLTSLSDEQAEKYAAEFYEPKDITPEEVEVKIERGRIIIRPSSVLGRISEELHLFMRKWGFRGRL